MNKREFIEFIAEKHAIKKMEAEQSLNQIIESISKALSQDKEVRLPEFGIFALKQREARVGHHPNTGKKIEYQSLQATNF